MNKYILPALVAIVCLTIAAEVSAQKDIRNIDNIACIGNGRMAVYEAKANIIQLFGPPYSSPSFLDMILEDSTIAVKSVRKPGTAIWTHELSKNNESLGTIVDLMDSSSPVFVRKFNLKKSLKFSIHFAEHIKVIQNADSYSDDGVNSAWLTELPRGTAYYNDYPMPFKQFLQLFSKGKLNLNSDSAAGKYSIEAGPGEGYIYFSGGPLYPDCISYTKTALSKSYESIAQGSEVTWKGFTKRRIDFEKRLPSSTPDRDRLLAAIDAVAVNIKTQQSVEGGVLAGHNYHLGYVRDQYGVSRGLLKMGYYPEAKGILNFFWERWKQKGLIHNAQGIAIDIFHMHENDEVEITGYLIIQAFDYLEKSWDEKYVREIFPMLNWAFNSQKKNLARYMLPFNGDETYVAGGILPRSCLIDGSSEATLLFITSGEKLITFAAKNKLWAADILQSNEKIVQDTRNHFRENFYKNERLYCNNSVRSDGLVLPMYRHGVCEGLGPGCEFYGWTQKNEFNRYLCPVCFTKVKLGTAVRTDYLIQSVSLMPLYTGSDFFSTEEIRKMVNPLVAEYNKTGMLPSRPDGTITVGYDYGLLLFNLTKLHDANAREIYQKMMSLLDETGSWVEFYESGKATGTRYRPWESGMNIESAIDYAESLK